MIVPSSTLNRNSRFNYDSKFYDIFMANLGKNVIEKSRNIGDLSSLGIGKPYKDSLRIEFCVQ